MPDRRPRIATISLLLMAGLVAGCLHDSDGEGISTTTSTFPQCIGFACRADPESRDARYVAETYGLTQINNDSREELAVQVEGNLVVWQVGGTNTTTGEDFSDLYAYDLSSRHLLSIERNPGAEFSTLPRLDEGRVLYHVEGNGIHLWNHLAGTTAVLPVPLEGEARPDGFQGDWVTIRNRGSGNETENAWWAWNIQDDRLVYLYKPYPENRKPDGSYATLTFTAIDEGVAYYAVKFSDPVTRHYNATLTAVNLTTQDRREYPLLDDHSLYRLSVHNGFAVSDGGGEIFALSLANETWWQVNTPNEMTCGWPTTGKGWLAYMCGDDGQGRDIWQGSLVNLDTGQRKTLRFDDLLIMESATDGETWVVKAARHSLNFADFYNDLYFMPVPKP